MGNNVQRYAVFTIPLASSGLGLVGEVRWQFDWSIQSQWSQAAGSLDRSSPTLSIARSTHNLTYTNRVSFRGCRGGGGIGPL